MWLLEHYREIIVQKGQIKFNPSPKLTFFTEYRGFELLVERRRAVLEERQNVTIKENF